MKSVLPKRLENGRVTTGFAASDSCYGAYGKFIVQGPCGEKLIIVASGADEDDTESKGWEHVSISTRRRVPNWQEMCFVKDLFWDEEECVVQFHPPRSEYVNNHPHVLHLWRQKAGFPMPPSILVGVKDRGVLTRAEAVELRREYFGVAE
jgi:hypothetical protein